MTVDKILAIVSVSAGDIVRITTSYFHVVNVRDPSHPAAPGVVWEGFWWRRREGLWGDLTLIQVHEGTPLPHVLDPRSRVACGWGYL